VKELRAQEFPYRGTDHTQAQDGNGPVVLLERNSDVIILGI
jgi:hypothetical protein